MKRLSILLALLSVSSLCQARIFAVYIDNTQQIGLSDWTGQSSCTAAGAGWKYAILHRGRAPGKFDGCWKTAGAGPFQGTIEVCLIYVGKLSEDCLFVSKDYFLDSATLAQPAFGEPVKY